MNSNTIELLLLLLFQSPPNFKLKDDIKNYQPPVAIVHTPPPEPTHDNESILIDTTEDVRERERVKDSNQIHMSGLYLDNIDISFSHK